MKYTFKVEQCNGKVSYLMELTAMNATLKDILKKNILIRKQTKLQFLNQLLHVYRIQLISVMFQMPSLELAISNIIKNSNTKSLKGNIKVISR